jgi:WD40 repeat protein
MFAPNNYILASRLGGEIRLWNGSNGKFVASLDYESEEHINFVFSRNGSRLASLTEGSATLWDSEDGNFIGVAKGVGDVYDLAVSDDGAFLAAAEGGTVKLWSGVDGNPLPHVDSIRMGEEVCLAFSRDLLAMACYFGGTVKLYDLESRTIISKLQLPVPRFLAISPNSIRLAVGNEDGVVRLLDTASIKASNPTSKSPVTALALSPDCSRLAAGFFNGTVKLWNTDQAGQPIASHDPHMMTVSALAFSHDDEQLASGSWDNTVRVWDGRDGSTSSIIKHAFPDSLLSVAFSTFLLAAATRKDITVWDRKTLCLVDTINLGSLSLPYSYIRNASLSFSVGASSLAIACETENSYGSNVTAWDIWGRRAIATFKVDSTIRKLTHSPDGSQVFAEMDDGGSQLFDVSTGNAIKQVGCEDLRWIPNFNGILISRNARVNRLMGRFPERYECIPLLYFPTGVDISSVAVSSSMFAAGCRDGIILVRS